MFPDAVFLAETVVSDLPMLPTQDPLAQYLYWSPIGPIIAATIGANRVGSFQLLHLAVLATCACLVGVIVIRRYGSATTYLIGATFVGSQAGVICLYWVGSYDVFTVGLTSLLVVTWNRLALGLLGLALAFAAFEQSLIIFALLGALSLLGLFPRGLRLLPALIGLLAGRVLLGVWLARNDVHFGRLYFLQHFGVSYFLDQFSTSFVWLVLTGLGTAAIPLAYAISCIPTWSARFATGGIFMAALVPVAISEDQTRVFAAISWPLVLTVVLWAAERSRTTAIRALTVGTLASAALLPGFIVWKGEVSLAHHHALRILRASLGNR